MMRDLMSALGYSEGVQLVKHQNSNKIEHVLGVHSTKLPRRNQRVGAIVVARLSCAAVPDHQRASAR